MGLLLYLASVVAGSVVGFAAWWLVAFQAISCFIFALPNAVRLRWRGILTSWIPALKYSGLGAVYSTVGYFLALWLWSAWSHGFNIGLLIGVFLGTYYSRGRFSGLGNWGDFAANNRQYIDEEATEEALENL
jgi:ABC-type xylose transport system permease subunit